MKYMTALCSNSSCHSVTPSAIDGGATCLEGVMSCDMGRSHSGDCSCLRYSRITWMAYPPFKGSTRSVLVEPRARKQSNRAKCLVGTQPHLIAAKILLPRFDNRHSRSRP